MLQPIEQLSNDLTVNSQSELYLIV